MSNNLLITNCELFNSVDTTKIVSLIIEDGIISGIKKSELEKADGTTLNAENRIITPGFIDVHIQGAGGADVLDSTPEALEIIAKTCARYGTTSFLATTVFHPEGDNRHLEVAADCTGEDLGGANLLGLHLEGPFISPEKRGMILPDSICAPSSQVLKKIFSLSKDTLKIMTIAPELEGSLDAVKQLTASGAVASFGHSNATYEDAIKGIGAGISHVTHLFNAMPALHHRAPGPLLAIFKNEKVSVQVIPDGVHLHPRMLKFAYELIGGNRFTAITDGMRPMGLPDGVYVYNGVEYESKKGVTRYFDGTLIGTSLGFIHLVLRLMEFTHCTLEAAVKTATENPAKVLCVNDRKGTIEVGKDADLVVLDHDYSVWATIVGGRVVFRKK
jgi:N-acetylglucosamine-6-phosphate deacetylase